MDVRNRMADVEKLRCNVCQDFLKLIIQPGWQQILYDKAKKEVETNSKFKDKYIAAYEKMRDIGIDHYSIDDMDVTFISEILSWGCKSVACVQGQTKRAMEQLREDRNLNGHSSENEEPEELYLRALLALYNLKNFVRKVDRYETTIDDVKRLDFRKKYIKEIEELKNVLDDERISLIQKSKDIQKGIQKALNSKDSLRAWVDLEKLYMDRFLILERDYDHYWEFFVKSSDAGIPLAHIRAAEYFFSVNDPNEGERRLFMAFESYDVPHVMESIIDMINRYLRKGNVITGGMKRLVEGIKAKGFLVELTADGFYRWDDRKKKAK